MVNIAAQPMLRAVGRVVGSDVLADAVAFFQSFAGMEVGFRERADDVIGLLRSEVTRFVVVASPRHETVSEAVWFARQLARAGHRPHRRDRQHGPAGVRGRVRDRGGGAGEHALAGDDPDAAALWTNLAELRTVREGELVELETFTGLLGDAPWVEVPQLAADVHDRAGLAHVGSHLFGQGHAEE